MVASCALLVQLLRVCDDVDTGLDNTCEVIIQETGSITSVLFSTPETGYIIYD